MLCTLKQNGNKFHVVFIYETKVKFQYNVTYDASAEYVYMYIWLNRKWCEAPNTWHTDLAC